MTREEFDKLMYNITATHQQIGEMHSGIFNSTKRLEAEAKQLQDELWERLTSNTDICSATVGGLHVFSESRMQGELKVCLQCGVVV